MHSWQLTNAALFYFFAVIISFANSVFAWKMRPVRGATTFSLMTFSTGIWSLGYLVGFFNANPTWKLVMLRVEYLGASAAVLLWLLFIARYTHHNQWWTRRSIGLLSVVPIITFLLVLTAQQQQFFYKSYGFIEQSGLIISEKVYGPGFYVWIAYAYSCVIASVVLLLRSMFDMPQRFRSQIVLLILVSILVLFPNLFFVIGLNPIAPYDPTCLSFVVVGFLMLITMKFYRFLDVMPVAYNLVFSSVKNGVLIIDERAFIQDLNPAAEVLLDCSHKEALGKPISEIFSVHHHLMNNLEAILEVKTEIKLDQERYFELQITPIINQSGDANGRIIMFYDISERKQAEAELRRQVNTDPLTGIFNRRHFSSIGNQIFNHAKQLKRNLVVLIIDIDQLKNVNHQYGYATGDQTIITIVNHLNNHTRPKDILGRLSGEEFVILMPDIPVEKAFEISKQIQEQLIHQPFMKENLAIPVSISLGVAGLDFETDTDLDTLISKAEDALSTAKLEGGNRIVVFKRTLQQVDL
jgi:diguanylate cyclase (GGDEF)-like protein/PAS domain S-box-containing protein